MKNRIRYKTGLALCVISILLLASLLSACGKKENPQEEPDPGILLGFSQIGSESAWRVGNTNDIMKKAEEYEISLMFEDAKQKQENQIAAIRRFIAYKVDVIAFSPIVEDGWDNVLLEAKNAGIPVILVDRDIHTEEEGLTTCLKYLIRKADSLGLDRVNIVEITGTVNSTPMRQRQAGFADAIAGDQRMHVLESIDGDFIKSRGAECMKMFLEEYGDEIDVVYSHNDEMTLGAIPVIEEAGLVPGKDIVVISIDGGQDAIDVLKQGKINCIVECTPRLGKEVMETVIRLKNGETVEKTIHPDEAVFSDEQDLTKLGPRGY